MLFYVVVSSKALFLLVRSSNQNLLIHALLVFVRFDINWIRDKNLRVYENIDCHPSLTRKEKQYLKGIHLRHKGEDLPKGPSLTDLHELRKAYGEIYVYMHQSIPLTTDSELYECDVMNYVHAHSQYTLPVADPGGIPGCHGSPFQTKLLWLYYSYQLAIYQYCSYLSVL